MLLKRMLSTVLIALLLLSLLAACTPQVPPTDPIDPTVPTQPTVPTVPTTPTTPTQPTEPASPTEPTQPTGSTVSMVSTCPTEPPTPQDLKDTEAPIRPPVPVGVENPVAPSEPAPVEPTEPVTVYALVEAVSWERGANEKRYSRFSYDEYGQLILRESKTDGDYVEEETYRYDEAGNLIYYPSQVGRKNTDPISCTYDEQGRLLTKITRYVSYAYTYDAEGRLLTEAHNNTEYVYTYDSAGNLIVKELWDRNNNEMQSRTTYLYNASAQVIYQEGITSRGTGYYHYYEYDEAGRLTLYRWYINNNLCGMDVYEYNENGDLIRHVDYYQSAIETELQISTKTYQYDKQGRLVALITRGEHAVADIVICEYWTYDDSGNLIKKEYIEKAGNYKSESVSEYTYEEDPEGRKYVISTSNTGYRYESIYDEYGNRLVYRCYSNDALIEEVIYTYTAFVLSPKQAEQQQDIQEEYKGGAYKLD